MSSDVILEVKNLAVSFKTELGEARAVDGVSFSLAKGETLGIVGESGCGKSVTSLAIMRLLPKPAGSIVGGQVLYRGEDLVQAPRDRMYKVRGNRISMIFQEPMTALNPVHTVAKQLGEVFRMHHTHLTEAEILKASIEMLEKVGIPAPEKRVKEYPHQLSGGMRQRVMIAIALACKPDILIADEPTTALDVTIQAQILKLIKDLQNETGMAVIFITHDLAVIAELVDKVIVMYGGRTVEDANVFSLFKQPTHPYTRGLLTSIPSIKSQRKALLPTIEGMVPGIFDLPPGCRFQNRCPYVTDLCRNTGPTLDTIAPEHLVRCHHWREVAKTELKRV